MTAILDLSEDPTWALRTVYARSVDLHVRHPQPPAAPPSWLVEEDAWLADRAAREAATR